MTTICLAEPGCFRNMHNMVQSMSGGSGRVEVIALAATDEGDTGSQYAAQSIADRQPHQSTASSNGTASDDARYAMSGAHSWLKLIAQAHAWMLESKTAQNTANCTRKAGNSVSNAIGNALTIEQLLESSASRDSWSKIAKHQEVMPFADGMHASVLP